MARWMRQITNGPSKWDLILGLFDSSYIMPRHLDFYYEQNGKQERIPISPHGIECKGNIGMEEWHIKGMTPGGWNVLFVRMIYSTQTRKGAIEELTYEEYTQQTTLLPPTLLQQT